MFAKLFKHEFLATWRLLATVVGVIFLVSCTFLLLAVFDVPVLSQVGVVFAFIGFVSVGGVVPILLAVQYWRTMYGPPGYLTHSLPVRGRLVFAAKVVYMCVMSVAGMAVAVAAAFGLPYLATRGTSMAAFFDDVFPPIAKLLHVGQLWTLLLVPVYVCALCVQYLCGLTLGTRGRLHRLGAGGAVIGLVAVYLTSQLVSVAALVTLPWGMRVSGPQVGTYTAQSMGVDIFRGATPGVLGMGWLPLAVLLAALLTLAAVRSIEHHTSLR